MPATIADLRTGLAAALGTISGLRIYEVVPEDPTPPGATIRLTSVSYDSTMCRGSDQFDFLVPVFVGRADDRTAQARLEQFIAGTGASSVKTAIEADPTLGGRCQVVTVTEAKNIGTQDQPNGMSYLVVDFAVTVHA